jgi:uncharacterized protein (DUF952 family)
MEMPDSEIVFKIATRNAWNHACLTGTYTGSEDDIRDGYIHLSTRGQLAGTLAKHFMGRSDLILAAFDARDLGDALRWERSRNGDLFPHLYALLPTAAARDVRMLTLDERGLHILPTDAGRC